MAELGGRGPANREIAESLFVTVRTVEFHLSRSYRKLVIESRAELTAALGDADSPHTAGQAIRTRTDALT